MQALYSFLSSEIGLVLHIALTLVTSFLMAWSLISGWQRQNYLHRENRQFKLEIDDLHNQLALLANRQIRHNDVLCKIGDHIEDIATIESEDFDQVRRPVTIADSAEPTISIDAFAVRDDEMSYSVSGNESTGDSQYFGDRIEPDVLLPLSVKVSDVSEHTSEMYGPLDDSINDESDPLTRALLISKTGEQ